MRVLLAAALGVLAGFAGGITAGSAYADHLRGRLAAAHAATAEAMERAGAACEPVWALAWPDGACAARLAWPPVACEVAVRVYRHPDQGRVLERAAALGPRLGLTVLEERGARERVVPITWRPEVH